MFFHQPCNLKLSLPREAGGGWSSLRFDFYLFTFTFYLLYNIFPANLSKFRRLLYVPKIRYVYTKRIYMKKDTLILTLFLSFIFPCLYSQTGGDTLVYLLTCGPGVETYSIYGHSALRITYPDKKRDLVYNWGVFDFDTPNFAWKFAKGRLDYLLAVESMQGFTQTYFYEKRFVHCQKLNITRDETAGIVALINENLKPENIKYRYDFFYDDCSTRIRDLIEKAVGKKLLYPPPEVSKSPKFRDLIGKAQTPLPWLNFGIDLLVGSHADKPAPYRDRMFLPYYLEKELSETVVNRNGKMVPLLQNPDVILDFVQPVIKKNFLLSPPGVLTVLFIIVMVISGLIRSKKSIYWFDITVFFVFSVLAGLMIFFNFFTDHIQTKWNLNILWLNPVIMICLILLIIKKEGIVWFRILFYILFAFLAVHFLLPQSFNIANLPLLLILLVRSLIRSGFEWNPLSHNHDQA